MQNKMPGLHFLLVPSSYSEMRDVHTLQTSPPIPHIKRLATAYTAPKMTHTSMKIVAMYSTLNQIQR